MQSGVYVSLSDRKVRHEDRQMVHVGWGVPCLLLLLAILNLLLLWDTTQQKLLGDSVGHTVSLVHTSTALLYEVGCL